MRILAAALALLLAPACARSGDTDDGTSGADATSEDATATDADATDGTSSDTDASGSDSASDSGTSAGGTTDSADDPCPIGAPCEVHQDCPIAVGSCIDGLCSITCNDELPCEIGWCDREFGEAQGVCRSWVDEVSPSGTCSGVPSCVGEPCDGFCDRGLACVDGECAWICEGDFSCPSWLVCKDGACVEGPDVKRDECN